MHSVNYSETPEREILSSKSNEETSSYCVSEATVEFSTAMLKGK